MIAEVEGTLKSVSIFDSLVFCSVTRPCATFGAFAAGRPG
jgi:hypothetical protein